MLILVAVRRFANDVVAPKVREMDENEMMDPAVTKGLFDQGVRLLSSASFAVTPWRSPTHAPGTPR